MTIFNWLATTWGSENQEEVQVIEYSSNDDPNNYSYQEPELEQKSAGMFDWIFGGSEQNYYQESESTQVHRQEPEQSYSQEQKPEQKPKGMFDWLLGTPEQDSEQSSGQSYSQDNSESYGIRIDNDKNIPGFSEKISSALGLLARYSPQDLEAVQRSSNSINSANTSGAIYWASRIDISREIFDTSDEYLAAVLVHEAEHNNRRKGGKQVSNSVDEELDCIAKQIQVLTSLNGSSSDIRSLENEDGTHYQREVTW